MYACYALLGEYYIEGVGYATVQDILTGRLTGFWLLLLLFGPEAGRHLADPGLGRVGRHLLARPLPGRDRRRRLRGPAARDRTGAEPQPGGIRGRGHGRGRGRIHRRGHRRDRHDLRDDPGLQRDRPDDPDRGHRLRHAARALPREHLHHEAGPPRAPDAGRPAGQPAPAPPGGRLHGHAPDRCWRRTPAGGRIPRARRGSSRSVGLVPAGRRGQGRRRRVVPGRGARGPGRRLRRRHRGRPGQPQLRVRAPGRQPFRTGQRGARAAGRGRPRGRSHRATPRPTRCAA